MRSLHQDIYIVRLLPGDDVKNELLAFAKKHHLDASFIISCVGSLLSAHLRTANALEGKRWEGPLEILSLAGTLSEEGCHLHASLSDSSGQVIGGHLLEGCVIYTTAEIVLGNATDLAFKRDYDPSTGHKELLIEQRL